MSKLITIKDFAKALNISPEKVLKLCETGILPVNKNDNTWFFWEDELDQWRKTGWVSEIPEDDTLL